MGNLSSTTELCIHDKENIQPYKKNILEPTSFVYATLSLVLCIKCSTEQDFLGGDLRAATRLDIASQACSYPGSLLTSPCTGYLPYQQVGSV